MTEKPTTPPVLDDELDEAFVKLKRAMDVPVAAIKRDLAQWLDQRPRASAATTLALMETACDRYLAARAETASDLAPAAVDGNDMIQAVLRRAVQNRRATLQMNTSAIPRAAAGTASDEECANRLADTLKILDTLTAQVPDHLVSREELASASEVLALLTGWFAGGIDEAPVPKKGLPMTDETSLKTARLQPMGGSGKQTASRVLGAAEDLDKKTRATTQ